MVLTRSQAAKQKASQSPEALSKVTKQHRKQTGGTGADTADAGAEGPSQALVDKPLNVQSGMGGLASKPKIRTGPSSHPIASLPCSPAVSPSGPAPADFTIAAVQQAAEGQQGQVGHVSVAAAQAGQPKAAIALEQQQEAQGPSAEASSVEKRQAAADVEAAAVGHQAAAAAPAAPADASSEQAVAPQQQAQPLAPLPRGEKLLKPLPDKPIPCDKLPDGPEPVQVEVDYVARQDLQPVNSPAAALTAATQGLEGADWVEVVQALNLLRQLVVHHPQHCAPKLAQLVPLVLKSVRSLRSSVCKTAIMAVVDLYTTYGDALLLYTDMGGQLRPINSLLAQLLLKAGSNDKKFVVEEAQRALQVVVDSVHASQVLRLLLPYAELHKNPKVRGKAAGAVAEAVARMQPQELLAFGHPQLLKVAAKLVTDNTPDARDAAKRVLSMLKVAFADPVVEARLAGQSPVRAASAERAEESEGEEAVRKPSKWEAYCHAQLSGSAALAVLKASSE